ncbi:DNA alkylation repair protein [Pontibacter qinzhouensis]|uniref:DNA alkylation repair protein n=1 Tax=Pontibacter qinzhouensis TaxID=2603253 RepID=A0A5C8KFF3_9BACT|nr:DNA alkylation repair protein [Pontibacter qinzhouensis]TXK52899.1 DNA alkylation repair protein [Pontibacter qinzhouensis]
MNAAAVLAQLETLGNPTDREGMSRFGISTEHALGIRMPVIQKLAKELKRNHELALELWQTKVHEARLLAVYLADPKQVTEDLMEQWVSDFNSWDLCDQTCGVLFDRTPFAFSKAKEWAQREPEYQKRASFVMMATLALHAKKSPDEQFLQFFPLMIAKADDNRNFVKKAVNWALRQIGKRSLTLNQAAIAAAEEIKQQPTKSARWIATDALRELQTPALSERLRLKASK